MSNPNPPAPQHNAGWTVTGQSGGGSDDGRVSWVATGHQTLTLAGFAALFSQISTYFAGRSSLVSVGISHVASTGGYFSVLNADLAAQQAAVNAILATAANVTGPAA